ncbi:hypothetical protein CY34DRAFT_18224 [Suillus luteus UH-Slu-Lm8-n1]|uniref:Uncharacterized protein n=1 Tax=Suillus luteus UH-Slu-Lm8-n1 TaxID=930992 RepID=A0A0D0A618_9AGAM|nr:hypothetical protein CY34DRAFT_18224 [Suillus luteus UH-Slu-Lm8-n1]
MNSIKVELPVDIQAFSFTFETSTPGPVTVEIAIRKSLKRSRAEMLEATDGNDTDTQRPHIVSRWREEQRLEFLNTQFLLDEAIKANKANKLVDESVTEPESEPAQ